MSILWPAARGPLCASSLPLQKAAPPFCKTVCERTGIEIQALQTIAGSPGTEGSRGRGAVDASLRLTIGTSASDSIRSLTEPGAEGFRIATGNGLVGKGTAETGAIEICSADSRGLLYGVGRFLREVQLRAENRRRSTLTGHDVRRDGDDGLAVGDHPLARARRLGLVPEYGLGLQRPGSAQGRTSFFHGPARSQPFSTGTTTTRTFGSLLRRSGCQRTGPRRSSGTSSRDLRGSGVWYTDRGSATISRPCEAAFRRVYRSGGTDVDG